MKKLKNSIQLINSTIHNIIVDFRKHNKRILLLSILLLSFTLSGLSPEVVFSPLEQRMIYNESVKYRINDQLIDEVNIYINKTAPETKLNAEKLVTICHEYELDIVFVLAQGLLESHFGTRGVASRTNSVFNVGTYDNGKILYKYKNPNESIEPYAILLTNFYLVDKNIINLIEDKGYVNKYGNRFASASSYEDRLRSLMVKIKLETSIGTLQSIYNMHQDEFEKLFNPLGNYYSYKSIN